MIQHKDFINIDILDTILDYIINNIKEQLKKEIIYDEFADNFIEFNRFEKANIILTNYYSRKSEVAKSTNIPNTFIDIVYKSLSKPFMKVDDLDNYYIDEAIDHFDNSEESLLFNNSVFNWFDYSDYFSNNKEVLIRIIKEILIKNAQTTATDFSVFDINVYNKIVSNPALVSELNWRNFERLLAKILEEFEYEVELQKGTKDGGIDIIALKKNGSFGEERYLIQAKKWKDKVGVEPVRSLLWAHNEYKVTKSCLVTTSKFTKGAWELANSNKWLVELKDYDKLIEWIQLAGQNKKL